MLFKSLRYFIIAFSIFFGSFLLTGCGFHLRGQNSVPQALHHIYLQMPNPYSPLAIQIEQTLRSSGVVIANRADKAPVTLQIISDNYGQQLTSISSNTQVRTYTLTYLIHFQIKDRRGKIIYGPQAVATTSTYTTSDNQLLADSNVLPIQRHQMMQNAVNQLFNRLNAKNLEKALLQAKQIK